MEFGGGIEQEREGSFAGETLRFATPTKVQKRKSRALVNIAAGRGSFSL